MFVKFSLVPVNDLENLQFKIKFKLNIKLNIVNITRFLVI